MKKKIFMLVPLLILTSCTNSAIIYSETSSQDVVTSSQDAVTSSKESGTLNLNTKDIDRTNEEVLTMTNQEKDYGRSTGSYYYYPGTNLEAYRYSGGSFSDFLCLLKRPTFSTLWNVLPSALYNNASYPGLYEIDLKYKAPTGFNLKYGTTRDYEYSHNIESSSSYKELSIIIDHSNYFSIEANDTGNVYIQSITLKYNPSKGNSQNNHSTYTAYRLAVPYTQFDDIAEGEKRSIPTSVTYTTTGEYIINETKEYTYHTAAYYLDDYSKASEVALTDPLDIAAYYTLFHDFPLNYAYQSDMSDLKSYFGSSTRQLSQYNRTDGYAKSVPYYVPLNRSTPQYYELDFDTNGTYANGQRGTGRLVIFEYGFKNSSYLGQPVILYTDDHYATFAEYMNDGTFGPKFDAEKLRTNLIYSEPITLI